MFAAYTTVAVDNKEVTVTITRFYTRGHHRSVAFVEELATLKWPMG